MALVQQMATESPSADLPRELKDEDISSMTNLELLAAIRSFQRHPASSSLESDHRRHLPRLQLQRILRLARQTRLR